MLYIRLRELREKVGKSQAEIAATLETAREQYRRYEVGERELPFRLAITLADYYGVSLDYLAGRSDSPD